MGINDLKSNSFLKNVLILVSGSIGAQIINMLAIPIITRMYGPEAYGLMGSFVAITTIVIPIAALTYPIAIVLPKSDREAKGIMKLSIYISIIMAMICLLLLILFQNQIVNIFNLEKISIFLYLIPIVILLSGFLQITEQWLIRKKQFSISAKATFLQAIVINSGNISFGLINPIAPFLIIFASLKNGIAATFMYVFLLRTDKLTIKKFKAEKLKNDLKEIARKYRDFPIYRAPETFLNDISQSFPILMLASFFGPASVGFYTISRTVLNLPAQLIGKAVGDVFYPHINEAADKKENIALILIKATSILGIIGIIPFGIVIMFGPSLFAFVFGEEWEVGGIYARWIAVWTYFSFINQPSVRLLPVLNAQKFHLKFTIFLLVARISAILIGSLIFSNDIIAIALFSISSGILNFLLIIITVYLCKKYLIIRKFQE